MFVRHMRAQIVGILLVLYLAHDGVAATCKEWQRRVRKLPAAARADLNHYGAYYDTEWLLIDEKLIAPCSLRADTSYFIGQVVNDRSVSAHASADIRRHAPVVADALARIWPRPETDVPGTDGAFRDMFSSLLIRPELPVESVRPLLRTLMCRDRRVTSDVAFALLTRPDKALLQDVQSACVAAQRRQDIDGWTFALAVLQRLGVGTVARQYETMLARKDLTPQQRGVIQQLADKARTSKVVTWEDVIDLEYS
jgi:hypothetical protein